MTLRRIFTVACGSLVALLALFSLGVEASLLLLGAFALNRATQHLRATWRGPAAWAIGILGSPGIVLAGSALVALVAPHLHARWVYLVLLIAPTLAGGLLMLVPTRRHGGDERGGDGVVGGVVVLGSLVAATVLKLSGPLHGIAWVMSGDARNHVAIMRGILHEGGLTVDAMKSFPVAVNALVAVVAGAGDRAGTAGALVAHDVRAVAAIYVLSGAAIGVLLAGAILSVVGGERSRPSSVNIVAIVAAAGAASPFVLGVALEGGFLSAYGSLPFALAGVVLALHGFRFAAERPLVLVALSVVAPLTFAAWTILAIVPGSLLVLLVGLVLVRRPAGLSRASAVMVSGSCVIAIAVIVGLGSVAFSYRDQLMAKFLMTGGTQRVHPFALVGLLLVALAVTLATTSRSLRRQMLSSLGVVLAGGLALAWLTSLPGEGFTWTYYSIKTNWLVSASLFWVPFLPVALWAAGAREEPRDVVASARRRRISSSLAAAPALATAVLIFVGSATGATDPAVASLDGWRQPSADALNEVLEAADEREPFAFWEWSDPGNDRLANFWAALAWASQPDGTYDDLPGLAPGGMAYWAYMAGDGVPDVCALAASAPGMDIHTRSSELASELRLACPAARADVIVDD